MLRRYYQVSRLGGHQLRTLRFNKGRRCNRAAAAKTREKLREANPAVEVASGIVEVVRDCPLHVQGLHGLEITPSIGEYAVNKVREPLAKFDSVGAHRVEIKCSTRGGAAHKTKGSVLHKVEVTVFSKAADIRVEKCDIGLYAAIDEACAALGRKLSKLKSKYQAKRGMHGAKAARTKFEERQVTLQEDEDEESVKFDEIAASVDLELAAGFEAFPRVERTKVFAPASQTATEAIESMSLLGHQFYVFLDADNQDSIRVVYERAESGYGVLVPVPIED